MSLIYAPQGSTSPGELIDSDTQIDWDGLLMGVDTYFGYKSLIGWDDLPGADTTSAPRPHAHGSIPGSIYAQSRIITFETQIWTPKEEFPLLRREFLRRFQFQQYEQPLTIRQHGDMMMCYAKVTGRSWPIDRKYFGGYPIASVQWTASDPRKYSVIENTIRLRTPSSAGGLDWTTGGGLNWAPGLDWGTVVTGQSSVNNAGLSDSPMRIVFNGPLTPPYYVNAPGNWGLGFTIRLAAGEQLVADARLGTVTLGGVDRYYALALDSDLPEDCLALPGATPVQFVPGATTDTGFADLFWRDAQM